MKFKNIIVVIMIILLSSIVNVYAKEKVTPVMAHGKLSVKGKNIVDENGLVFQIRGVSTHGIGLTSYYHNYISQESLDYMRDEWKINTIRLARYTPNNDASYLSYLNREEIVKQSVRYAINSGLYVIIDWHVLKPGDPNEHKEEAIAYFKEMAALFKDYPNIIYEICNEPNGDSVTWDSTVKPYALDVIKEIRKIDDDAIIAVGSSKWTQDLDKVLTNPIDDNNIIYTLHFYAASRGENLRNKLKSVLESNLPVLISEFGICSPSGTGDLNYDEASKWMKVINDNKLGFIIWQLTNKNETSSLIRNDVSKLTNWTYDELTDHGKWFVDTLKMYKDDNIIHNKTYNVIEGQNQTYKLNSSNIVFKIDADYDLFKDGEVYIDSLLLNKKDYLVKKGSTIIEINKDYASNLSLGSHVFKAVFSNNKEAQTSFTVIKQDEKITSQNDLKVEGVTDETNPKTSDEVIKYIILALVSLLSNLISLLYIKLNLYKESAQ